MRSIEEVEKALAERELVYELREEWTLLGYAKLFYEIEMLRWVLDRGEK